MDINDLVEARALEIVNDPLITKVEQIEMLGDLGFTMDDIADMIGVEYVEAYLELE